MKIKDQVVSLGLAEQLKNLGIKQKSLFYYIKDNIEWIVVNKKNKALIKQAEEIEDKISAFTVSELGELLPVSSDNYYNGILITISKTKNTEDIFSIWQVNFNNGNEDFSREKRDEKLVDAIAKMLIFLIENNLNY